MNKSQSSVRMGVDIGGTFTDVVIDIDGTLFSTKVLTTHEAPERGILAGMRQACRKARIEPGSIEQIIHGTTLATNALIERRGARTALITTEGFRDVIEMRTESRFEQYDLNLTLPEPLLERQHRQVLTERVDANGEVLIPLQRHEVEALADRLATGNYESVAVGFIHSYLNDSHERLVGEVLAERLPDVTVSLSSDVSPQMREYERFNTVVANAYIKPMMKRYLDRLKNELEQAGAACPVFLMHSGGGIISLQSAAEFPVRLVESGPAGGAVFAADIARRYALNKVVSFDMGGTTAKICLIRDQSPTTSRVFEVARTYRFKKGSGMPISIPVIDMVEIGAGGGSLAQVDSLRRIRVGPESAGSEPGPACYGLGGQHPAVTDADLLLGRLDPADFAGGSITLQPEQSAAAIDAAIGKPLDMDPQTAAFGLSEVVDENMANAARVHAVENGEDLSDYTMIAFGGAAPLHAARLCEKLGVRRLLVPPGAGVGSAIGFLRAPFSFEATRSLYMRLSAFDAPVVTQLLAELEAEAVGFVRTCDADAHIMPAFKAYMRYSGQGWEIPVEFSAELARQPAGDALQALFEETYMALFGRIVEGMDIDFTVWTVNAATPLRDVEPAVAQPAASLSRARSQPQSRLQAKAQPAEPAPDGLDASARAPRSLFDPALGKRVEALVVPRDALVAGDTVAGPAVITESETSIVLPSSRQLVCQADGCLDILPVDHRSST